MSKENGSGLWSGVKFTVASIASILTIVVPIFSIIPGTVMEMVSKELVNNVPYSNVGVMTIILLSIIFIGLLTFCMYYVRKTVLKFGQISQSKINLIFISLFTIVHSLGFYIYWAVELNFRSDGQLIFGTIYSIPFSSFTFFFIGLLIDFIKDKAARKRMYGL